MNAALFRLKDGYMTHGFSYIRPKSLEEVIDLLSESLGRGCVFSGGTDLFVDIRAGLAKPDFVVDLKSIESLHRLSFDKRKGLSIGACVTVNGLTGHADVQKHYAILVTAGKELATHQIRNRASVVGNLVTASPCGDMASPLLCLDAELVILSKDGSKNIRLSDFITGVKNTILRPGEIVEKILVPTSMINATGGYKKLKRIRGHDLGVVSVAMLKRNDILRFAISSAAPTPVLLPDFSPDTTLETIQAAAQKAISPIDDVRCSREYRAFMVNAFIERLMEEAG
jgi:carbon-monoxide dehydrogenase medium subunit